MPGLLCQLRPKATDSDPDKRRRARQTALEERARLRQDAFPPEDRPVDCLIEREGPGYYKAARLEDPKKPLKNALPSRCNRLVQIIKPVNRDPNPDAKSTGLHPFENTEVRKQDIERITAALLDLLRPLGRLPTLPPLFGTAPLEVSALWLTHAGPHFVPMMLRMHTDGTVTGQLIPSQNHPGEPEIPLEQLPAALAEGRGKMKRTDRETPSAWTWAPGSAWDRLPPRLAPTHLLAPPTGQERRHDEGVPGSIGWVRKPEPAWQGSDADAEKRSPRRRFGGPWP
ncbi:hypothetical protein ACFVZA_35185 [Streptomyces bottropensis]|uniref:hypothetical protein n=1 Tax=Streptomyces bottropensis TaxID=42235 RepID=UPI0036BB1B21